MQYKNIVKGDINDMSGDYIKTCCTQDFRFYVLTKIMVWYGIILFDI